MTTDKRTLRTARTLPFSPAAVYGAFAAPELLAGWWGPDGFSNTFELFEFREGGRWHFVMHGPDGQHYPNRNRFEALQPGRRLVIRHDCAPYFTMTVELKATGRGTRIELAQVFDDAATAQALAAICIPANEQNLDRLTRVLAAHSVG